MQAQSLCMSYHTAFVLSSPVQCLSHYGSCVWQLWGARVLGHTLFPSSLLISHCPFLPTAYSRPKNLLQTGAVSHCTHIHYRAGQSLTITCLLWRSSQLTPKSYHTPHHEAKPGELLPFPPHIRPSSSGQSDSVPQRHCLPAPTSRVFPSTSPRPAPLPGL